MQMQVILLTAIAGIVSMCAVRLTQIWQILKAVTHVPQVKTRRAIKDVTGKTAERKRSPRKQKVIVPAGEKENGTVTVKGLFGDSLPLPAPSNG